MNESISGNIKQIFASFNTIITIYENKQWLENVSSEQIKIAFKVGHFVEKTMECFNAKGCTLQFMQALKAWHQTKNRTQSYDEHFYSKICDNLLIKFFQSTSINEQTVDVAVRIYTSLYPRERLEAALADLIVTSASHKAIIGFAEYSSLDLDNVTFELILNEWTLTCERGKSDQVRAAVKEGLSSFRVQQTIPIFIGILALDTKNCVTEMILESLLEVMFDRSVLSKNFWNILLDKSTLHNLVTACNNYGDFLGSLCDFLIYIGSMMEADLSNGWKSDCSITTCSDLTFGELRDIFRVLCRTRREIVLDKITNAEKLTEAKIWLDMKLILNN